MDSRDLTQVIITLGSKHPYPLSHPTSPDSFFEVVVETQKSGVRVHRWESTAVRDYARKLDPTGLWQPGTVRGPASPTSQGSFTCSR